MAYGAQSVDTTIGGVVIIPQNLNRRGVMVKSLKSNANTVFLRLDGSSTTLTAANGYPLEPGESICIIDEHFTGPLGVAVVRSQYWCEVRGITTVGTSDIRWVELT